MRYLLVSLLLLVGCSAKERNEKFSGFCFSSIGISFPVTNQEVQFGYAGRIDIVAPDGVITTSISNCFLKKD